MSSLAHQSMLQEDLGFTQKIEGEKKKNPSPVHTTQYIIL